MHFLSRDLPQLRHPEHFVDATEAAEFLSIHPKTLQKFARSGLIPAHPFGEGRRKLWRYLLSELELWLRARGAPRRDLHR